jgi:L-ribulose-5-phosphate 4-epimerase
MYRRFEDVGGVVHTHSTEATGWAQAGRSIPAIGTTHADHFHGTVPVTRQMTTAEIEGAYEAATGSLIVETLEQEGFEPLEMPAVLIASHGPFCWGKDAETAVDAAIALEAVASMARRSLQLEPALEPIADVLLERHFSRKHGPTAYYGQRTPGG